MYTVHFQMGNVLGARENRYIYVNADSELEAIKRAKAEFPKFKDKGFRVVSVRVLGAAMA